LLAGLYPSMVLSGYKPVSAFKNQARSNSGETRNAWLRKSLTISQFVIAQFFIIATALVGKELYYVLHKDLGFKKDAILVVATPWNAAGHLKQVFMNDIKGLAQVKTVSIGGASPSSDNTHSNQVTYADGKKQITMQVQERFGDENYINVYGIKLLAGRDIRQGDVSKAFLINEACVKALGFTKPEYAVGISLGYAGKKMQVTGVINDFYYKSLHTGIEPLVILSRSDNSYFSSTFHIALKPETADGREWSEAIASIQASWEKLYPDSDFEYYFFDASIAKFYESEQQTSTLLNWATFLSILISCMGLLGLTIYTINQRTREIGIRKVLGATVTQITALLSKELVGLIALAFAIAGPAAWWAMHKWLQSFAERTTVSWWIFVLSGIAMLLLALLASGFQTIKAALMNPVKSLRSE
jgi:putative ABC transport system permease protein